MDRAYSVIEFKAIDEERRTIEGIASTPTTDRMDDIVEPLGMVPTDYAPFKWQHGRDAFVGDVAVGHVYSARPNAKGIPVKIQMERDDEPGHLKDILDFAWKSILKRLVRGLSIGFRALESEPIKGTFGLRFIRWELLELSAVTIPANADATITTIKSYDLYRGGRSLIVPPKGCEILPPGARSLQVPAPRAQFAIQSQLNPERD